jgi:hypothetical protein
MSINILGGFPTMYFLHVEVGGDFIVSFSSGEVLRLVDSPAVGVSAGQR